MSRFSIIIFPFFYAKISRNEEIFSKNSGKFSAAAAAAEKDIGLHLYINLFLSSKAANSGLNLLF
jgi:hypothetical protein